MDGSLNLSTVQFAFVAQLIAVGGVLWGLWKSIGAAGDKQGPVIEAVRKELIAKLDAEVALASKSRHDMGNALQAMIGKIDLDVDRLKRETVRRDELSAIEARLGQMFTKVETKMDLLSDRLASLLALEKQVQNVDNRLAEALRRLDKRDAGG